MSFFRGETVFLPRKNQKSNAVSALLNHKKAKKRLHNNRISAFSLKEQAVVNLKVHPQGTFSDYALSAGPINLFEGNVFKLFFIKGYRTRIL